MASSDPTGGKYNGKVKRSETGNVKDGVKIKHPTELDLHHVERWTPNWREFIKEKLPATLFEYCQYPELLIVTQIPASNHSAILTDNKLVAQKLHALIFFQN